MQTNLAARGLQLSASVIPGRPYCDRNMNINVLWILHTPSVACRSPFIPLPGRMAAIRDIRVDLVPLPDTLLDTPSARVQG